ncbi:MAG: hypothetical protein MZV70_60605 [Desulfobacterales bacterium]|nr:hypothetical protein [Desulfobacterales bacterium]
MHGRPADTPENRRRGATAMPPAGNRAAAASPGSSGPVSRRAGPAGAALGADLFAATRSTVDDLTQLLWAAQGITHAQGYRTAPSAGALYPLELYAVVGRDDRAAGRALPLPRPRACPGFQVRARPARGAEPRRPSASGRVERAPLTFLLTRGLRPHDRQVRPPRRALRRHGGRPRRPEPDACRPWPWTSSRW